MERDDQTGYAEKVIIEAKNKKKIPVIKIFSEGGDELKTYNLPVGAYISIEDNAEIVPGQKIVKIPRNLGKIQDITGGLPRVTELLKQETLQILPLQLKLMVSLLMVKSKEVIVRFLLMMKRQDKEENILLDFPNTY